MWLRATLFVQVRRKHRVLLVSVPVISLEPGISAVLQLCNLGRYHREHPGKGHATAVTRHSRRRRAPQPHERWAVACGTVACVFQVCCQTNRTGEAIMLSTLQSSPGPVWAWVEIHSSSRGCFGSDVAVRLWARSPLRVMSKQSTHPVMLKLS